MSSTDFLLFTNITSDNTLQSISPPMLRVADWLRLKQKLTHKKLRKYRLGRVY
jgi:hypothetical protein